MCSLYVPLCTKTVSPEFAVLTAACIVWLSSGIIIVAEICLEPLLMGNVASARVIAKIYAVDIKIAGSIICIMLVVIFISSLLFYRLLHTVSRVLDFDVFHAYRVWLRPCNNSYKNPPGLETREIVLSFTVASSSKLGWASDGLEAMQPTVWSGMRLGGW